MNLSVWPPKPMAHCLLVEETMVTVMSVLEAPVMALDSGLSSPALQEPPAHTQSLPQCIYNFPFLLGTFLFQPLGSVGA